MNQLQINLATLSFLLLFPGYFLYHYAVGRAYILPVLGGYFGIVAALLLVPLAISNLKLVVKNFDLPVLIFFFIILLTFIVTFTHYAAAYPIKFYEEMFVWSISGAVFNLVCFFLATRLDIHRVAKYGYWLIFLMVSIVISNIGDRGIFYLKAEADNLSDIVSGYQGFARSIVVTLLITCAYYFNRGIRFYSLVIFGLFGLFFNGARTEFILYIFVLVLIKFFYSIRSFKALLNLLLLITISVFVVVISIDYLPDSRMLLLLDFSSGSSGEIRWRQIVFALEKISQNPILGDYGSYVELGSVGSYPHNVLSAWLNLGLVGFFLYIVLFMALWITVLYDFLNKKNDEYFKIFLFFLVFVTVALIVSKNHSYMLVGLLVGFYVQYCNKRRGF